MKKPAGGTPAPSQPGDGANSQRRKHSTPPTDPHFHAHARKHPASSNEPQKHPVPGTRPHQHSTPPTDPHFRTHPHPHTPEAVQRWRRRRRRFLLRLLAGVLATIFALGVFLYHVPVSPGWVNRRVAAILEQESGMAVSISSAKLYAFQRRYVASGIDFQPRDGATSSPAFSVGGAEIKVRPLALLFGASKLADSVWIRDPSDIEVWWGRDGVALPGMSGLVDRILHEISAAGHDRSPAEVPFNSLRVSGARLTVVLKGATTETLGQWLGTEDRATAARIRVRNLDFSARSGGGDPLVASFSGIVEAGAQQSGVEGDLTMRRDGSLASSVVMPRLTVERFLPGLPGSTFEAADVRLGAEIEKAGAGIVSVKARIGAARWALDAPGNKLALKDSQLQADATAVFHIAAGRVELPAASLHSEMLDCDLSGDVATSAPNAFNTKIVARKLGGPYRALIARLLPSYWTVTAEDDSILLDASVSGDRFGVKSVIGKLLFERMRIAARGLDHPVDVVKGEVDFEPERLVLHGFEGRYNRTTLSLDGDIKGDYFASGEGVLVLNWAAAAAPEDLLSVFRFAFGPAGKQLPRAARRSSGIVATTGTLVRELSPAAPPPRIDGKVEFRNVALTHPLLPTPVRNLAGNLTIKDNRLNIERATGETERSHFRVAGALGGADVFWRDPWVTATVSLDTDLAEASRYLPEETRAEVARYRLHGTAKVNMELATSLADLREPEFNGSIDLSDVGFDPRLEFMACDVSGLQGRLYWNGSSLRLEQCSLKINGEPMRLLGTLSTDRIMMDLGGSVDLGKLPATFPKTKRWVDMRGPARGNIRVTIKEPASPAPAGVGKLTALLSTAGARVNAAVAARTHSIDGSVTFGGEAGGATIRHNSMPPAKTDKGRDIPAAQIENIRGTAMIVNNVATVSPQAPLTCSVPGTPNCTLSGTYEVRPDDLPRIDLTISALGRAALDPWVLGWGKGLPDGPPPVIGPKKKNCDITVRVNAARGAVFRGQQVDRASFDIVFRYTQLEPSHTEFRKVEVSGFGGRATAKGSIDAGRAMSEGQSPRWQCDAQVRGMRIRPLRTVVLNEDVPMAGSVDTNLSLSGIATKGDTFRGRGTVSFSNVDIGSAPFLLRLFQLPIVMQRGRGFERNQFSTVAPARYTISDGAVSMENLALNTQGMLMDLRGKYFFGGRLDLLVRLKFLESSILNEFPVIDEAAKLFDSLAGQLLAFRIRGTTGNPSVEPVPLSLLVQ